MVSIQTIYCFLSERNNHFVRSLLESQSMLVLSLAAAISAVGGGNRRGMPTYKNEPFPMVRPQPQHAGLPLARRPRLLFNHNPKAGGGSLLLAFAASIGPTCKNQSTATPDCFVHVRESCWTGAQVRREFFVIGSVREPCDQYVSLWAFGSAGNGRFSHECRRANHSETAPSYCGALGTASPRFDSAEDVLRFQQWVQNPLVMGTIARRFRTSYIDNDGAAHVDCWVVVDRFIQTLVSCLRAFEAHTRP